MQKVEVTAAVSGVAQDRGEVEHAGYRSGSWLLPVAALCGAVWSLTLPASGSGDLRLRAALALGAALGHVLLQILALEIAGFRHRFLHASAFAVAVGSVLGGVLLALAKAVTHHRPLGAVSVAVISVGLVLGLVLMLLRLGSARVVQASSAWLPFVLLAGLVLGLGAEVRGVAVLGLAVAVGLRVGSPRLLRLPAPRWVDWVLIGLLLGGNFAAW